MMATAVRRGWPLNPSPIWRSPSANSGHVVETCRPISPSTKSERLEVCDQGNALKVRTDDPHLVSLGSGRLSTAVTLLPLPEGRVLMGCGGSYIQRQPDILVQGTGVEPLHCYIENIDGVVTLYPLGELTSVDGIRITTPIRLTQGSMICIGRSNYYRFNHPEEAELMKTILPNARISSVPLHFAPHPPGVDNPEYFHVPGSNGGSAFQPVRSSSPQYIGEYLHPRTLTCYDDEDDTPSPRPTSRPSSSPISLQQHKWNLASPKVFLPNSSTVSLPASAVLGLRGRSATPTNPSSASTADIGHKRSHSFGTSQSLNLSLAPKKSENDLHKSQNLSHCSIEALAACEEQLEERRRQAQQDRLLEEELEREERARLDEILQMCAEYQRQIEEENQTKLQRNDVITVKGPKSTDLSSPTSTTYNNSETASSLTITGSKPPPSPGHSLHPNRIKTNGSLPRERRVQSPNSVRNLNSSEDELNGIFTFDISTPNTATEINSCKSPYENVCMPQSPRTRIRTTLGKEKKEESEPLTRRSMSPSRVLPDVKGDIEVQNDNAASNKACLIANRSYSLVTSGIVHDETKREIDHIQKECQQILCLMSTLKNYTTDVEHQIEEAIREAEMEKALLQGEVTVQQEKIIQDEKLLDQLKEKDSRLEMELELFIEEEGDKIAAAKFKMEQVENKLNRLEEECDHFTGTTDEETILLEKIKHQHELLDSERKAFEDLEFQLMENVAHREAEREELHKEMANIELRLLQRKTQVKEAEQQQKQVAEAARNEASELDIKRRELFQQIEEEKTKLSAYQKRLVELFASGQYNGNLDNGAVDNSSDNEENGVDVERKLEELRQLGHSQDDLDRIEKVASHSLVPSDNTTLGRKASATLQEIERNRQLLLVKQGTQVLEQERRRVAELKRRVQDQVRQQWEERRQQEREQNCHSLNSVGSEDSSLAGSDVPPESLSSDDALAKTCTTASSPCPDNTSAPSASITSILEVKVRQKEHELQQALEDCRPLSEASSFGDDIPDVRLRDKQKLQQQRPLTRYLPIRSDGFDLRQHVETAGHQVELCPHVTLTSTTARGYLHKMGSRFKTWNKRWFVFDRTQRAFLYFTDKSESRTRGGAYFQAIEEVYVDHLQSVRSPNPKLTFCVKTRERTYHLMAPTAEAMRIWVDVIFTGAEGYQQFQHT